MKKLLLSIVMVLAMSVSAFAQGDNKNQLSVSWGTGSMPEFRGFAFTLGSVGDMDFDSQSGMISAQFLHFVTPKLGLGAILSFEKQSGIDGHHQDVVKDIEETDFAIMPAVSYYWMNKDHVGLYSKAAVGVNFIGRNGAAKDAVEDENAEFAYQVSLLGVEVGGSHLRAFAEGGLGFQGIVQVGVRVGF